ncbi:MAG: glycosyltransferase [Candidatus Berkelbacteria bacterium]
MKILFVAMSESVHTARWIAQIANQSWDIHLFPSYESGKSYPELKNLTIHHTLYGNQKTDKSVRKTGVPVFAENIASFGAYFLNNKMRNHRVNSLNKLIKKIKPDIVHSLELQGAGYLVLDAKKRYKGTFPKWIATNWGSDIYLFGRLASHRDRIKETLKSCDYYSCESQRDVQLARDYGFRGITLPVFPNTGGFDLEKIEMLRKTELVTSKRRVILLKGYYGWAGRSLFGIRALERCADLLRGYEVVIYSAVTDGLAISPTIPSAVEISAELFAQNTGIPVRIMPSNTKHIDMLKMHGRSRISIGLSISDGISTALLEAMAMGSFPIQSRTATADEWIKDSSTGLLVSPEDPDVIEKALRIALTNDDLVDLAAVENYKTVNLRLDSKLLKRQAVEYYQTVYRGK